MKLIRLAQILEIKYKFADNSASLEDIVRRRIDLLWDIPNKSFNILKACADSGASKPKNENEQKAVEGFKFCRDLLNMINYLKINKENISLGEIQEVILNIVNLIDKHKDIKFNDNGRPSNKGEPSNIQFPHVSELIFQLTPVSNKHAIKLRNELYGKARTGLSRILSICNTMNDEIKEIELIDPDKFTYEPKTVDFDQENPSRFKPQRAPLSNYDVIDFIRQHGDEYGLSSKENWELAFRNDPGFKEQITTVINALNRGHRPRDAASVKEEIADILEQHRNRKVI